MKRHLLLIRDKKTDKSTLGKLSVDGLYVCETLELPWRENKTGISCIPPGNYPVVFRKDPGSKYNYPHLHVQQVPGRTWILFHVGNYPSDTRGCILPGTSRGEDFVGDSREAFNWLMELLDGATEMQLTVS